MRKQIEDFAEIVRAHGLKATEARIRLLALLSRERHPLSVLEIEKKLGTDADTVTLYRTLEAFSDARIVRRADFAGREARYELAHGREHHHHLVCRNCGDVEDVATCGEAKIETVALAASKKFSSIQDHALEFFGTCRKCISK